MARLLPGYTRLAGSSKRILTPEGYSISDRAYHAIVVRNRINSPTIREFEKALAKNRGDVTYAKDVSGISKRQLEAYRKIAPSDINPFAKVKGRYVFQEPKTRFHAFISESGLPQYDVAFVGNNLTEMRILREAIAKRDQTALDAWKRRHPNGIVDRYGTTQHPETSLRKINAAKRRMTPAQRDHFASREHYSAKTEANAA